MKIIHETKPKASKHLYVGPGATHDTARRVANTLAIGSRPGASADERRRAVDALRDVGPGYGSQIGRMLRAAFVRGAFDTMTPLAVFSAMPTRNEPPPDRRLKPDAVDNLGVGAELRAKLAANPIDVVLADGSIGFEQQSAGARLYARQAREQIVTAASTVGGFEAFVSFDKHGHPRPVAGIDPGQDSMACVVVAVIVELDENRKPVDPWPNLARKLSSKYGVDVSNKTTRLDPFVVEALVGSLSLLMKTTKISGRCMQFGETVAAVSLASEESKAATARRAQAAETMTNGVGARVMDESMFESYHTFCRSADSFTPIAAFNIQQSLNRARDVRAPPPPLLLSSSFRLRSFPAFQLTLFLHSLSSLCPMPFR